MSALRTTRAVTVTAITTALLAGGAQFTSGAMAQAAPQPSKAVTKTSTGKATTTADLSIRTTASTTSRRVGIIRKGNEVAITGKRANGMAQIYWMGNHRWVSAKYLAVGGAKPPAAQARALKPGVLKATANLAIRERATVRSRQLGTINKGNEVAITGKQVNGMAQLYWMGKYRWVNAKYLSSAKSVTSTVPSRPRATTPKPAIVYNPAALPGSSIATKRVAAVVSSKYPQITTIYGIRIDPGSDHHTGRAADVMLPNYRSNQALGWEIANEMRSRASELNISYVIFQQKIWSVARSDEGWRPMADRGGDTANHIDHVHISVR
ncbi:hypothetical protein AAEX63_03110 [Luteococcus sp. H138]|uniref:SH3 domain-containing protein n=1 Tax=unclassified Luteococcus TaxID=2639923 RepID=UPI00313B5C7F